MAPMASRGLGTGRILSQARFGRGGDRPQSGQVRAQSGASGLGEHDLPSGT